MRTKIIISIFTGVLFVTLTGFAPPSSAEMNVSIGIGVPVPHVVVAEPPPVVEAPPRRVVVPTPPPVVVHEPPPVVVIPGTYVYFAPDVGMDIFFYHGYWYRPHHGHWYRSRAYDGPWHDIEGGKVPHRVRNLPPDFRYTVRHNERIRYVDVQRNWKAWEHDRHWDRSDYKHEGRGHHDGGR
jgi:hypothetical protein